MELIVPLVYIDRGTRSYVGWVPEWGRRKTALTLSELRDEVAIHVMETVEHMDALEFSECQLAPHVRLRHIKVQTEANDRKRRRRIELEGRIGVLVENWPRRPGVIVTPTRAPHLRFFVAPGKDLKVALTERLIAEALEDRLDDLDQLSTSHPEQLELLSVDVYPPTILPSNPRRKDQTRKPKKAVTLVKAEVDRNRERMGAQTLRSVCTNLSHQARDGLLARANGRTSEVERLVQSLGTDQTSVVLLGPSGVGKTAIVHEVIRRLAENETTSGRRDVWSLDANRFIAGMSYVGQWEGRARALTDELTRVGDVVFAPDLLSLAFAGRTRDEQTNLAQFLEPGLRRGQIAMIAECTEERFARLSEEAPGFAALFQPIRVSPLTERETIPVLLGVARRSEGDAIAGGGNRKITPQALGTVVSLASRFYDDQVFPGKAVRLLREVLGRGPSEVTDATVVKAFQRISGLPQSIILPDKRRAPRTLERRFAGRVAGQPAVVQVMTRILLTLQQALENPTKPVANLLLVGPSGVGKTESAKALASMLFGNEDRLIRFDMSELSTPAHVDRFIGIAGGQEGELIRALRRQPFCVLLLDEIEKAHPLVFDALLQLLGEGRISDASGHLASARKAVIVMTSNLGVSEASAKTGFLKEAPASQDLHYRSSAERYFRPEMFNRIDDIVPFRALDEEAMTRVVQRALDGLLGRRGVQQGRLLIDVDPELVSTLVEEAADPRYGARPLRQALERRVTVPLAHRLVSRRPEQWTFLRLFPGNEGALGLQMSSLSELPAFASSSRRAFTDDPDQVLSGHRDLEQRFIDVVETVAGQDDLRAELDVLRNQFELLEVADLEPLQTVETIRFDAPDDRHNWNAKHNRPTAHVTEGPIRLNRRLLASGLAPKLGEISDQLEVIEHRGNCPEVESWVIVVRFLTERDDAEAIQRLLPVLLLDQAVSITCDGQIKEPNKLEDALADGWCPREVLIHVEAAGLREMISPLCGLVLAANMPLPGDALLLELSAFRGTPKQVPAARDENAPGAWDTTTPEWPAIDQHTLQRRSILWKLDGDDELPPWHAGWSGTVPSSMRQVVAAWLRQRKLG